MIKKIRVVKKIGMMCERLKPIVHSRCHEINIEETAWLNRCTDIFSSFNIEIAIILFTIKYSFVRIMYQISQNLTRRFFWLTICLPAVVLSCLFIVVCFIVSSFWIKLLKFGQMSCRICIAIYRI